MSSPRADRRQAPKPQRVGIRQLRQNLSVYVKRVREEGRAYEVTERGEPVARLTPLKDRPTSLVEQMIADVRITPATRRMEDLPPPVSGWAFSVSEYDVTAISTDRFGRASTNRSRAAPERHDHGARGATKEAAPR